MRRRTFLKVAGGTLGTAVFGQQRAPTVGVVGGGIVGASIAFHLADAGADVTLFEKQAPASGATGKSFAWINAYTNDPHYRALRMKSVAGWHELDQRLKLNVVWGGSVHWATSLAEAELMRASAAEFDQSGYETRLVGSGELTQLVPNVRLGPFEAAMFNVMDGHIDPVEVTKRLIEAARDCGAKIVHPCEVRELGFAGDRLTGIATTNGDYVLDRLIVSAGTDTPGLMAQTGFTPPLKHAPGILLHTTPQKPVVGRVVESAEMYFKQNPSGRIVGNDSSYAPHTPEHEAILRGPQEMPAAIRAMHGERILGRIREKMPGAVDAEYDFLTLGYRPMPVDEMPIVGFSPGNADVYVAVMHSGVTLAPIMGRYVAHEILNDRPIDELAPYRPDRF